MLLECTVLQETCGVVNITQFPEVELWNFKEAGLWAVVGDLYLYRLICLIGHVSSLNKCNSSANKTSILLNIKTFDVAFTSNSCASLTWNLLASDLIPQSGRGSNNVLPPNLSDSNWFRVMGVEIPPTLVVAASTWMSGNAISQRYGPKSLVFYTKPETCISFGLKRSILHLIPREICFSVHNGLVSYLWIILPWYAIHSIELVPSQPWQF